MFKRIKSVLFVVCIVMAFTAQTNRPDDKGQQHAPAARTAVRPAARPAPAAHTNQSRPQVQRQPQAQTRRAAPPQQAVQRTLPRVHMDIPQPLDVRRENGPHVYAVPESTPAPVGNNNNRLFHRQHQNHWQPMYNFYNNQYQFYPYVNVTSPVELSANVVSVVFNGQTYYYDRGAFYIQDDQGQYMAVAPPLGIIVNALPSWARQINADGQIYYRCKGVFYVQTAQGYQVVGAVQSSADGS